MAQLDDVHSVLRLSYETPKGMISLVASPSVAKLTDAIEKLLCDGSTRSGGAIKMSASRPAIAHSASFQRNVAHARSAAFFNSIYPL
jgi:hypothetical protein